MADTVALCVDVLQATRAALSPFLKSSKCLRVSVLTSLLAPCDRQSESCNVKASSLPSGGDKL